MVHQTQPAELFRELESLGIQVVDGDAVEVPDGEVLELEGPDEQLPPAA